jgi:hypothetical protein
MVWRKMARATGEAIKCAAETLDMFIESHDATQNKNSLISLRGAPSARTVVCESGASAMPPRRVFGEERGGGSRLEAALARLEKGITGRNPCADRLATCPR